MKKLFSSILILGILLSLGACGEKKSTKSTTKEVTHRAQKATLDTTTGFIDVTGFVEANDSKKIFVNKKLKVKTVFVQEGDFVEKGQVLMTFDETERNNIKRNLEKEKINLSKLQRNYKITKELNKIGGASGNSVKELEEEIKISKINIEYYQEDLEKTVEKIQSPVSGTITTLYAQENYSVNTDDPLLELADLSDIKIILEVPEYDVKEIKLGQNLIIKPEVFEKKISYPGKITKISRVAQVSKTTSENILKVEVKPTEEIPHIVPGFKVSSRIYLGKDNPEIIVPATALLFDKEEKNYFMFISDSNGILEKRTVEFKDLKGDKVAILKGLTTKEIYLTNPEYTLLPGDKVTIDLFSPENTKDRKGKKNS
ncbi:MAG: efflux RND transporter periplasmic adaptor subunit [Cetobacterium sp.]